MLTLPVISAIETPNLILREIAEGDSADMACFMTQPRYQKFIAHRMKDANAVKLFVARQLAAQGDVRRNVFHLAAEERHSGEVVGDGFLIIHQDEQIEIGWGLHPALWQVGFGTEIGRALLAIGFERFKAKSISCKVMRNNVASLRLARRIGMKQKAAREDYPVGQGRFEQVDIFAMSIETYFDLPY
jgi:[ribosomal protein S5]-alanine N-acetyltransferase